MYLNVKLNCHPFKMSKIRIYAQTKQLRLNRIIECKNFIIFTIEVNTL